MVLRAEKTRFKMRNPYCSKATNAFLFKLQTSDSIDIALIQEPEMVRNANQALVESKYDASPSEEVEKLTRYCEKSHLQIIIGANTNFIIRGGCRHQQ
ncbi:hypothetical protein Trydic_g11720 [Trypoxylus dichotomus]